MHNRFGYNIPALLFALFFPNILDQVAPCNWVSLFNRMQCIIVDLVDATLITSAPESTSVKLSANEHVVFCYEAS